MLKFTGSINPESILGWEGIGVLVGYKIQLVLSLVCYTGNWEKYGIIGWAGHAQTMFLSLASYTWDLGLGEKIGL